MPLVKRKLSWSYARLSSAERSAGRESPVPNTFDASSISDSTPEARTTRHPVACSTAYSSKAVLPTPGSPRTTSTPLRPARTAPSSRSSAAHSGPRPSSTTCRRYTTATRRDPRLPGGATAGFEQHPRRHDLLRLHRGGRWHGRIGRRCRLSENPDARVVLVEAGPAQGPEPVSAPAPSRSPRDHRRPRPCRRCRLATVRSLVTRGGSQRRIPR
jgi:hypothetical protein